MNRIVTFYMSTPATKMLSYQRLSWYEI